MHIDLPPSDPRTHQASPVTQAYYGMSDAIHDPTYGVVGVQQQPPYHAPPPQEPQYIKTARFGWEPVYYPPTTPTR
jgi:hypothetical protein